jgi:biotin transport system substrate-specific component
MTNEVPRPYEVTHAVISAAPIPAPRPLRRTRTQNLVAAALIGAVMAVLGPVAVTAGTVPITLQIFPVVLAALLLPSGWAAAAMVVYLVLGAIGVPVYAHGTGGLGVLLGPTGGYIVGFVLGAAAGASMRAFLQVRFQRLVADIAAGVVTVGVVYLVGWAWLAFGPSHVPPLAALAAGVAPFIVPDLIKAGVAILVAISVRRGAGVHS